MNIFSFFLPFPISPLFLLSRPDEPEKKKKKWVQIGIFGPMNKMGSTHAQLTKNVESGWIGSGQLSGYRS